MRKFLIFLMLLMVGSIVMVQFSEQPNKSSPDSGLPKQVITVEETPEIDLILFIVEIEGEAYFIGAGVLSASLKVNTQPAIKYDLDKISNTRDIFSSENGAPSNDAKTKLRSRGYLSLASNNSYNEWGLSDKQVATKA